MTCIATRPVSDVCRSLSRIATLPIVLDARTDRQAVGDGWERVGIVEIEPGIERVPPSICRVIGQEDFGIERIERYPDDPGHIEVVLR